MRVESPTDLAAVCRGVGNRYPDAHLTLNASGMITADIKERRTAPFAWPGWVTTGSASWQRAVDDLEDWVRKLLNMDPFHPIEATFVYTRVDGAENRSELKMLAVRVSPFRVEFRGGPTGFEVYRLEAGLLRDLESWHRADKDATFCICAGTPGSWPTCTVKVIDVLQFIQEAQARCAREAGPAALPRLGMGG